MKEMDTHEKKNQYMPRTSMDDLSMQLTLRVLRQCLVNSQGPFNNNNTAKNKLKM